METALVIVLEDAEPFDEIRSEFAIQTFESGVPFHLTLLSPFATHDELSDEVLAETRAFFAAREPFELELTRLASWPSVVYAVPEPDTLLRDWMQALFTLFPQWPPYSGEHAEVVPHATLGEDVNSAAVLPEIARRLESLLPVRYPIDSASLLGEFEPGRWRERERFPLGG